MNDIAKALLSLTERRVVADWRTQFSHPLFLLETFVDVQRFHGGVYRAANWMEGYSAQADAPKRVFVRLLCRDTRAQLTNADRNRLQLTGVPKIMLNPEQMRQLPQPGEAPSSACAAGHRGGGYPVRSMRGQCKARSPLRFFAWRRSLRHLRRCGQLKAAKEICIVLALAPMKARVRDLEPAGILKRRILRISERTQNERYPPARPPVH